MSTFLFSATSIFLSGDIIELDSLESRHASGSLRLRNNDPVSLLNGKGAIAKGIILSSDKSKTLVKVNEVSVEERKVQPLTVGFCRPDVESRFEWFLEKATELGVATIVPIISKRTVLKQYNVDRFFKILIASIKQSGNAYLPVLTPPVAIEKFIKENTSSQKAIAHCLPDQKTDWLDICKSSIPEATILIGPEGDFNKEEIDLALSFNFTPVSLGKLRLRTETAGIYAATVWNAFH